VASYIEQERPLGATVTCVSASQLSINVNVSLIIDTLNVTLAQVTTAITTAITNYLASIAFVKSEVSFAQIGALILGVTGVIDYSNLLVNNGTINIPILDSQVEVLGGVVIG
jgi:uncharacterized phage protein gp47/JayE